jgi:hypothetical protein
MNTSRELAQLFDETNVFRLDDANRFDCSGDVVVVVGDEPS